MTVSDRYLLFDKVHQQDTDKGQGQEQDEGPNFQKLHVVIIGIINTYEHKRVAVKVSYDNANQKCCELLFTFRCLYL